MTVTAQLCWRGKKTATATETEWGCYLIKLSLQEAAGLQKLLASVLENPSLEEIQCELHM